MLHLPVLHVHCILILFQDLNSKHSQKHATSIDLDKIDNIEFIDTTPSASLTGHINNVGYHTIEKVTKENKKTSSRSRSVEDEVFVGPSLRIKPQPTKVSKTKISNTKKKAKKEKDKPNEVPKVNIGELLILNNLIQIDLILLFSKKRFHGNQR